MIDRSFSPHTVAAATIGRKHTRKRRAKTHPILTPKHPITPSPTLTPPEIRPSSLCQAGSTPTRLGDRNEPGTPKCSSGGGLEEG